MIIRTIHNQRWVRVDDIIDFFKEAKRDPEGNIILLLRKLKKEGSENE